MTGHWRVIGLAALATACAQATEADRDPAPARAAAPVPAQSSEARPPEARATPTPPAEPARRPQSSRLVAVGDLHGDLDNAESVLRLAGLVEGDSGAVRWSGGDATLVQTGDTTDRGPESRAVIGLLRRLADEAAAAGGRVVPLLGNHELMNMQGDWRYVDPGDIDDFGGVDARRAAFAPRGEIGEWLRSLDAVALVDGVLFAHGGVSRSFARTGPKTPSDLSAAVRAAIDAPSKPAILRDEGPLWYRGYMLADEPLACAEARDVLAAVGATRMAMGHTTQKSGHIASRCGGRVLGIDTGISDHYGGRLAALEIVAGDARALYTSGSEDLPDPDPAAPPATPAAPR